MNDQPTIKPIGADQWQLVEDFGDVPKGFVTDGASVPRLLWRILGSPMETDTAGPSIEHDYDYTTGRVSRKVADDKYYCNLRRNGVGVIRASCYWLGVRLFGWLHYQES